VQHNVGSCHTSECEVLAHWCKTIGVGTLCVAATKWVFKTRFFGSIGQAEIREHFFVILW
jgi:hypothetical protein